MMRLKGYVGAALILIALLSLAGCSKTEETGGTAGGTNSSPTTAITEAPDGAIVDTQTEEVTQVPKDGIAFSKSDYFYSESIDLEILSGKPGKIYYTTDGTDPSKDRTLYNKSIRLEAGDTVKATCIKAKAFYEDGTESGIIVHTYFVGADAGDRFDTLVFSVTTDPYNLFDYNYGIFVEGKLRADYIKENPTVKINPDAPANYNMRGKESERAVYLEAFEPDGTKVIGQAAGIRTYGGWSRAREQKSIKIFARKEYDENNSKFKYSFFPEKTSAEGGGNILDTFKQIVLRNCGNDNGFGFIRDELFETLAGKAGDMDYEAVRPAALYVNGDYRGFFWLHEVYCDEYFADHYGRYQGSFEILEGGELEKSTDSDGANTKTADEYNNMYNNFANLDLTDDTNYQKVCEAIDVKNYLEYYALQTYIGNEDWPHNNYRTYRYYAVAGEEYREAPFDGKWRYLFHDMDYSFGIYGAPASTNTIAKYVGTSGEIKDVCPLFGQLMRRADCREIFIKKTLDLLNGAFAPEKLNSVLDQMNKERINELQHTYNKSLLEDWVAPSDLSYRLRDIKNYGRERASYILSSYKEYFGLGGIYALGVKTTEGCQLKINSYVTDKDFEGSYYTDYDTELSVILSEGKKLDYWLVNGTKVEDERLLITPSMVKDNIVEVSFVLK